MARKDISSLNDGEIYDEVKKVLIKAVEDMPLDDLIDHFIEERMDYYMNHADEDEINIILEGE
tara:strand:+ start:277 stop:465 length:189 start_codon:yes stop_codon:yes gene_type:complete